MWLESTTRVFQQLECTSREAYTWWETITRHISAESIDWELFQLEFHNKYVGELYSEDRKQEFLLLK
ncbi:Hexaprenyldihydroxybenzoate methyltransferase, mitochondrial-like protein [Gossypium australe]|uniref:Hexaprenyldihydroxybenzoate methyltransferase, mitochondrial-like protein n=1 Tax=Gossypium australe TaxID=47621 RepID=A0A5B6VBU2_9ROSI|nr:Hexaprenyldihydroxybenzoate methyltransferase, mitochondrial-like protein [Gossypium australe]